MSWKIKEKHRKTLAGEIGAISKDRGGKLSVCLVYPNMYSVAMSNLGFQTVYAQFNSHGDVVCERAFAPDPKELQDTEMAVVCFPSESQQPLEMTLTSSPFRFLLKTITSIFLLSRPGRNTALSADRDQSFPLIMAGGAALTLNPEPVARFCGLRLYRRSRADSAPADRFAENRTTA